jgi:hypothetical protein
VISPQGPDYKKYTLAQLEEVLTTIDKAHFPENYQRLLAELERRKHLSDEPELDETLTPKAQKPGVNEQTALQEYWDPKQAKINERHLVKLFGLVIVGIFLGVLCLPAYFHSFLLKGEYVWMFRVAALSISILGCVLMQQRMGKTSKIKRVARITPRQRRLFNLKSAEDELRFAKTMGRVALVVTFPVMYFVMVTALPVVVHSYVLTHQNVKQVVTVASKGPRYRRKHCNGRFYVAEYQDSSFDVVCNVLPRERWENLRPQDTVKLKGTRSAIGLLVTGAYKSQS